MSFERDVCVVGGCGRVGLPIGLAFAEIGRKVTIYDINEKAVEQVARGEMPFYEQGAEELLGNLSEDQFLVTTDPAQVSRAENVVVIIGTPVDDHLNPDYDGFSRFIKRLSEHLVDGQLLVLRSTVYPGTTARTAQLLERYGKGGVDLSFCPERVAEGKALEEFKTLPQIISGTSKKAEERATKLFAQLNDQTLLLDPAEAELAKLFTNSWRYIQFATANQFYMIAEERGLDFHKIYEAMRWKYPRTQGFPGAGFAAGPCLFKDTMQLASFSDNSFFLGHSAMLVNEGLPNFIVNQLKDRFDLRDKIAGILGMAFKGNIDDPRSSLSYKLKKILAFNCSRVLCTDPYVADPELATLEETLEKSDIILLGAPHAVYKELKFPDHKVVVDVWKFWDK